MFRYYLTDCLQAAVNNTAAFAGGTEIKQSFRELFIPDRTEENSREAQDIIEHLKTALAGKGGDK